MVGSFKFHINRKFQKFQQELSAELRMMLRSKDKPFKTEFVKANAETDSIITYKEIFIDENNEVFFKANVANAVQMTEEIFSLYDLSVDDVVNCIMAITE